MHGLQLHLAPGALNRLLDVQRAISDHVFLVGVKRGLCHHNVCLCRVLLLKDRAGGHSFVAGPQNRPVNIVSRSFCNCDNIKQKRF